MKYLAILLVFPLFFGGFRLVLTGLLIWNALVFLFEGRA